MSSIAWLVWRWTKNEWLCGYAVFASATVRFWNVGQQDLWLIWFPVHPELLVFALFIGSIAAFDWWLESRQRRALVWTWLFFGLGLLSKEYALIFPLVAAAQVLRPGVAVERRKAWLICGAFLLAVVLFALYRHAVLGDGARNPTLKPIQFLRKPVIFAYIEAGAYLTTNQWWLPSLGTFWFVVGGLWLRARQRFIAQALMPRSFWENQLFNSVAGPLVLFVAATCAFFVVWQMPIIETVMMFFTGRGGQQRSRDIFLVVCDCYVLWLAWKYRRSEMLLIAWCCWILSYGPVLDYIGWHYTLGPSMLKSVYFAVAARVIFLDIGGSKRWEAFQRFAKKS